MFLSLFSMCSWITFVRNKRSHDPKKTENMRTNERKHANHKGSMSAPLLSFWFCFFSLTGFVFVSSALVFLNNGVSSSSPPSRDIIREDWPLVCFFYAFFLWEGRVQPWWCWTTFSRDPLGSSWPGEPPTTAYVPLLYVSMYPWTYIMIEGSLEVKLPTIWTDEKQSREEAERRERVRRKKMQMREKVGKSRNTVFFQWFGAPEGRKVGSLKRRVRSQLARWEMKNCTPLWREAHFEVKMYKAPQRRTTFGSWDVENVHAIVVRSTFPSQN